jgi:hypothetical protein
MLIGLFSRAAKGPRPAAVAAASAAARRAAQPTATTRAAASGLSAFASIPVLAASAKSEAASAVVNAALRTCSVAQRSFAASAGRDNDDVSPRPSAGTARTHDDNEKFETFKSVVLPRKIVMSR